MDIESDWKAVWICSNRGLEVWMSAASANSQTAEWEQMNKKITNKNREAVGPVLNPGVHLSVEHIHQAHSFKGQHIVSYYVKKNKA